jgi:kinesin family protein 5
MQVNGKTMSCTAVHTCTALTHAMLFHVHSDIKQQVQEALNGYNCTIFAYGQTGSGKTHTMMGPDLDAKSPLSRDERGIIPRIADDIFLAVMDSNAELEFTIKVSFVEIYMERIRDLLNARSQAFGSSLKIREDKQRGIAVEGATEVYCGNVDEMLNVMRKGSASRAIASTRMNQDSSRSHSVFIITIGQRNVNTSETKTGGCFS